MLEYCSVSVASSHVSNTELTDTVSHIKGHSLEKGETKSRDLRYETNTETETETDAEAETDTDTEADDLHDHEFPQVNDEISKFEGGRVLRNQPRSIESAGFRFGSSF